MILAIDPGNEQSAWVTVDQNGQTLDWAKVPNAQLLDRIRVGCWKGEPVCIEMIASYGMAVGKEVFETCLWIGRFLEALEGWKCPVLLMFRREVKLHLCESPKANDSNIRAALIDRFGPTKEKAIGVKSAQGPLYGMKADCWQALALAVTYFDKHNVKGNEPSDDKEDVKKDVG